MYRVSNSNGYFIEAKDLPLDNTYCDDFNQNGYPDNYASYTDYTEKRAWEYHPDGRQNQYRRSFYVPYYVFNLAKQIVNAAIAGEFGGDPEAIGQMKSLAEAVSLNQMAMSSSSDAERERRHKFIDENRSVLCNWLCTIPGMLLALNEIDGTNIDPQYDARGKTIVLHDVINSLGRLDLPMSLMGQVISRDGGKWLHDRIEGGWSMDEIDNR